MKIVHSAGEPTEERHASRAIIQAKSGQFDLDTPIFEGDWVEVPDPRQGSGGTRSLYAAEVHVNDTSGSASFRGMGHINVRWGQPSAPRPPSTTHNYHGPVVTVHGDNTQLAWGDGTIAQSHHGDQTVTAGYEGLAEAVASTLQLLEAQLTNDEDRSDARDVAEAVLAEVVKPTPDPSALRRGLNTLKGLLAPIATKAATAVATAAATDAARSAQDLIHRLTLGS